MRIRPTQSLLWITPRRAFAALTPMLSGMPMQHMPHPQRLSPNVLAWLLVASAITLVIVWMVAHQRTAAPDRSDSAIMPDRRLTPGAVDQGVTDAAICAHDWAAGDPPQRGGDLTYSKAARHTSANVKREVFAAYHIANPHDGGRSWEIDHLVPLALGGLDVAENLWPQSRTGDGLNAWAKDRLEYRLYRLVCEPQADAKALPLAQAQAAIRTDWVAAYRQYCGHEADCPAFGGK